MNRTAAAANRKPDVYRGIRAGRSADSDELASPVNSTRTTSRAYMNNNNKTRRKMVMIAAVTRRRHESPPVSGADFRNRSPPILFGYSFIIVPILIVNLLRMVK